MQNNQGFLLINIYAFLVIFATSIIFFSKERMRQVEDELYKKFLIVNLFMSISGLLLGFVVSSIFLGNTSIVSLFNKAYLVSLSLWICILTFYTIYVSKSNKLNIIKFKSLFKVITIISSLIIVLLPIDVKIDPDGGALASGISVIFAYSMFIVGFLIQIFCVFSNYKNLKNKKFIPLYLLIFFATIILITLIVNPKLNYIINPAFILIAFVMYHTIENPDMKLMEEVHNAKVISDNANEEKTMFLYNITNKIREISKDINNKTDEILDETANKKVDLEYVNNNAREIKNSANKFTTMTNEMLDITSLDASNIKIYNEKYNIKLLLKEIVTKYAKICKDKNLEFRTNIQSDLPEILYGDSLGLKNVLISLLDNSIKYTKKGYIELNVDTLKKQDYIRLLITVEDSGIGIPSLELDKIFNKNKEELTRGNLKNNLFTARKIITLMNGALIPSSTYRKGTTMKIILDQKVYVTEGYAKIIDKKKILLIEDNDITYKLIQKLLKDENIIIDRVSLGSIALDKIRNREKYDLILIEEELSPLDAYSIIKKLKSIKSFHTKVILISKDHNKEYNDEYKSYGFEDLIVKPIDKSSLLNILNKC